MNEKENNTDKNGLWGGKYFTLKEWWKDNPRYLISVVINLIFTALAIWRFIEKRL